MVVGSCPECGSPMGRINSVGAMLSLPNTFLHNSDIKCSNWRCGYGIDLAEANPYSLRKAYLVSRATADVPFAPKEVLAMVVTLGICAGHEEKLARYINFENFKTLVELKIDFKDGLRAIDFDTQCCINPFYREALSDIVKALGYESRWDFTKQMEVGVPISRPVETRLRDMISLIDPPSEPAGQLTLGQAGEVIVHLYY